MIRAVVFTFRHWWTCPLCRWNVRALLHDLRLKELRYVRECLYGD